MLITFTLYHTSYHDNQVYFYLSFFLISLLHKSSLTIISVVVHYQNITYHIVTTLGKIHTHLVTIILVSCTVVCNTKSRQQIPAKPSTCWPLILILSYSGIYHSDQNQCTLISKSVLGHSLWSGFNFVDQILLLFYVDV